MDELVMRRTYTGDVADQMNNHAPACITMLRSRILVERDTASDRVGSILLPETSQERPVSGVVKAVGPEVAEVKVGDRIYYAVRGRKELTLDGIYHQIIQEADVFGVEEA